MRQFVRCGYWFSLLVQCFGVNVHSQDLVVAAVNNFPMYEKLFPLPRWRDLFSTPFLENVSHRLSLMSRSVVREYIFAVWQTMLASEVLGGGHSLPAFWLWFLHASTVECCSCLWFPKSKEIHHLMCARRWVRPGVWPEPGQASPSLDLPCCGHLQNQTVLATSCSSLDLLICLSGQCLALLLRYSENHRP